jgi:hypothetical protein
LGAETPLRTIDRAVEATRPDLTVLASFDPSVFESQRTALRRLAGGGRLLLGGPGATESLCARLKVGRVEGDLVAAASKVAGAMVP